MRFLFHRLIDKIADGIITGRAGIGRLEDRLPSAIMGAALASVQLNLPRPTVGLLNIGTEEIKGHEEIREAGEMLRAMNLPQLDYIGFVEGDGIGKGAADVVVTEGFCGNVALKAAEGTARQVVEVLRGARSPECCCRAAPSAAPPRSEDLAPMPE